MHWSIDQFEDYLIERPSDHKVAQLLNSIKERYLAAKGEEVLLNQQEVAAYTKFYMPTNARKFDFLWSQLDPALKEKISKLPWVDFGCGPGTFIWPAVSAGVKGPFYGIDSNPHMLKQAKRLGEGLFPKATFNFSSSDEEVPFDEEKTLIFGNAVNEMGIAETLKWVERINPKFIIFIEPGTSKVFKELLELRASLKAQSFEIHYPCCAIEYECPISKKAEADWCHQVLREVPHPSIERIGQIAKMDRKIQPYIAHVYELDGKNLRDTQSARFVRFLNESKYSFNWEVCLNDNGTQSLVEFEIPKKDLKKRKQKKFKKLSVGHEVKYTLIKKIGPNRQRVSVEVVGIEEEESEN